MQQRQQIALEARQERLRLGIAETAVELDHAQPVLRPHQPRVEEALERRAAARELAEHRQVDGLDDLLGLARRGHRAAARTSPCRRCSGRYRRPRSACSRGRAGRRPRPRLRRARRPTAPALPGAPRHGRARAPRCAAPSRARPGVRQTQTPLPAASPSSLTTHGGRRRASVRAVGTPAASITSFANDFEPSICAAAALGPNTAMPRCRSSSASPATSGASGPTTTRSIRSSRREGDERAMVVGANGMAVRERCDARVARRRVQLVDAAAAAESDQASACSRPPDPTTSTRTGAIVC